MSGHVFRGRDSRGNSNGLAFNKIMTAILCFPKVNISVWINQGHSFTVNPSQYATSAANAVETRYRQIDNLFHGKNPGSVDARDFRNQEHYKSLTEDDGTLNILCKMFLAGLAANGRAEGANGIFLKRREHSVQKSMHNRTGRQKFFHEVQFVAAGKVGCVWKLEAEKVKHGAEHSDNMTHAISEISQRFNRICALAPANA